MRSGILGTREALPDVWLRLVFGDDPAGLAAAAAESGAVVDVSTAPALWGGFLRATEAPLAAVGGGEVAAAADAAHAADLVQAHLFQVLAAVGRTCLDCYILSPGSAGAPLLQGAAQGLSEAREDGLVRFLGLAPAVSTRIGDLAGLLDPFDLLLLPDGRAAEWRELAAQRAAVVLREASGRIADGPVLVSVRSAAELRSLALGAEVGP